ncbi:hypothetical protein GUJ93_ZPchr0013g33976 [Zizania palustris]|uniref:Cupin type-1 domain-containing protein n=1 Tax=Zizania palustris TaxID=103762 RepID=A0A8J5WS94_ZIZPA|nr:hypothetical protein GUJ93_ZPchr0013g33976 [Zizania palustris]
MNAHSVDYMIQGSAQVQVVNNQGRTVFDGVLHQGQLLIIPQNYVVIKKAERDGCQYISFKTSPNAMGRHLDISTHGVFLDIRNGHDDYESCACYSVSVMIRGGMCASIVSVTKACAMARGAH